MSEWSHTVTFAIAMIILAGTIALGISNVMISNNAGREINDNLDTKIQSTDNYTKIVGVNTQDYATAQVTLRSILCSTPCLIRVDNKRYLYYNMYSGVRIDNQGNIQGQVGAENLSREIFHYMSSHKNLHYTFTTGQKTNILKKHGAYVVLTEGDYTPRPDHPEEDD